MNKNTSVAIAHHTNHKSSIIEKGTIPLIKRICEFHKENSDIEFYEIFEEGQLVLIADSKLNFKVL